MWGPDKKYCKYWVLTFQPRKVLGIGICGLQSIGYWAFQIVRRTCIYRTVHFRLSGGTFGLTGGICTPTRKHVESVWRNLSAQWGRAFSFSNLLGLPGLVFTAFEQVSFGGLEHNQWHLTEGSLFCIHNNYTHELVMWHQNYPPLTLRVRYLKLKLSMLISSSTLISVSRSSEVPCLN